MNILFLSHSITELGGYYNTERHNQIKNAIHKKIVELIRQECEPQILTSLNIGVDMWSAFQAFSLNVPYTVYVPCKNVYAKWPKKVQQEYIYLYKHRNNTVILNTEEFTKARIKEKDLRMINDADIIYTIFQYDPPILDYLKIQGKDYEDLFS